jgi:hypothetical protein
MCVLSWRVVCPPSHFRRDALTVKVASLRSSTVAMTPAQREKQRKQFVLYRDAWAKRKR